MPTPHRTRWAHVLSWACRSERVSGAPDPRSRTPSAPARPGETILHATTVAVAGRAALIRGAAGRGKSGLALQLIALGAELVADDRTRLWRRGEEVMTDAPPAIRGRIEARGVGLMRCPASGPVPLRLIVDMDHDEPERLPPMREEALLGVTFPVTRKAAQAHFPAAILLYLRYGRSD